MKFTDFSGGMADINVNLAPANTVALALNVDLDSEIGSAVSRLGTARIGSQLVAAVSVLGIVQHVDQADTTKNKLFATANDGASPTNSDIYDVSAGSKSLQDDTHSLKTYFLNYAGDTLRLNGTDAPKAYDSSNWITTGGVFDLANMPTGYKYPKEFLSRVYLWGKTASPYTLVYSGTLTAGAVSWTSGPGYLLLFKRRSMTRWNFASAFPESLVQIGAYSQESIVEGGGLCAFYSDSNEAAKGFYITNGGRPVCISQDNNRPIKKWVDAISSTAVVAGFATDRYFCWSVGALTVDGETYSNVVLKYNRLLNQWTIRTYISAFTCFANYVASGVLSIVGGDNAGTVYQIDKAATYKDANTTTTVGFQWKVRQLFHTYGENRIKALDNKVVLRGKNLNTARINGYTDDDLNRPIPVNASAIVKRILSWFGIGSTIRGTTIALEVGGESVGAPCILREIDVPVITIEQNYG